MTLMQAFWFGLTQGLTEFLPVSSSGHLQLLKILFGMENEIPVAMDVLLHVGTLLAVICVYWKRIWNMICHPIHSELPLLVLATVPAVVAVLVCKLGFDFDIDEFFTFEYLGFFFLITTLILWMADLLSGLSFETKQVRWYNALTMGLMQVLGLLSGISRSGSTMAGGVATGLSRKRAADFAFLMSIPAILGALVFKLPDIATGGLAEAVGGYLPLVVGIVTAAIASFLAIKFMLAIVRRIRLSWFGVYTGLLGVAILADQYFFHLFF